MTARPLLPRGRPWFAQLGLISVLALVLAACGGGGGGGNGGATAFKLNVAVVNETDGDIAVSMDAFEPGEPETVTTCTARVLTFEIPAEDWQLTIDGEPAIDSLELDPILLDKNLIARVDVNPDRSIDLRTPPTPGRQIDKPAAAGLCL